MSPSVSATRIDALVLAAGRSSRMGARNKLLIKDRSGQTMVSRVVHAALGSRVQSVVVVTGHQAEAIEPAARAPASECGRLRIVHAPLYAAGLSASLQAGIAAIADAAAALVCLADMPLVTAPMLDRLIAAFVPGQRTIVVPVCRGMRGNPVLWDRTYFPAFAHLSGDRGARTLMAEHAAHVTEVAFESDAVLRDFDTPGSLDQDWQGPLE